MAGRRGLSVNSARGERVAAGGRRGKPLSINPHWDFRGKSMLTVIYRTKEKKKSLRAEKTSRLGPKEESRLRRYREEKGEGEQLLRKRGRRGGDLFSTLKGRREKARQKKNAGGIPSGAVG